MKKAFKILIIVVCFVFIFTNLTYAANIGNVSPKVDKNGYYTITTTSELNLTGTTTIQLTFSFAKDIVTKKSLEKNGKIVSATIISNNNVLKITPLKKLDSNCTYTIKLITKSYKKYLINIKSKAVVNKTVSPTATPTTVSPTTVSPTTDIKPTDSTPTSGPTSTVTALTQDDDGCYILSSTEYLNTSGETLITLPIDFADGTIDTITIDKDGEIVPADMEINLSTLKIDMTPYRFLTDGGKYTIRIFTLDGKKYKLELYAYNVKAIDFTKYNIYKIAPNPEKGFNYAYYLYVPAYSNDSEYKRLVVETNNPGIATDSIDYFQDMALNTISWGLGKFAADGISSPLLVPAFPRPRIENLYTHALTRPVMDIGGGDMKRLDLQLIAMIDDAQETLKTNGLTLEKKVFMVGFSASACFSDNFIALHPDKVKAVYSGGFDILPTSTYEGCELKFPFGVSDISKYTGKPFDVDEYKKVAQFHFHGDQDMNDLNDLKPGIDGVTQSDCDAMNKIFPVQRFPDKWNKKQEIINKLGFGDSIQFHTYKGIGHAYGYNFFSDEITFFRANNTDKIVKIDATEDAN